MCAPQSKDESPKDTREPSPRSHAALDAAAAAAAASQLPQRVPSRSGSVTLREAVLARAGSFRDVHFPAAARGGGADGAPGALLESGALQQLRGACAALPGDAAVMGKVLELLTAADLSVFELLTSGAVRALTEYLRGVDLPAGAAGAKRDELLLRRLRAFGVQALSMDGAGGSGGADTGPPMLALVRKLQSALASTEAFPVVCSRVGQPGVGAARSLGRSNSMGGSFGAGGGSLSSGLQALMEPFKLRLVRHPSVGHGLVMAEEVGWILVAVLLGVGCAWSLYCSVVAVFVGHRLLSLKGGRPAAGR